MDGVILNPGAWSHYSWAIRDAVELFDGPGRRGAPLRHRRARGMAQVSVLDGLVAKRIVGKGPDGYREALEFLVKERG